MKKKNIDRFCDSFGFYMDFQDIIAILESLQCEGINTLSDFIQEVRGCEALREKVIQKSLIK